MQPELYEQYTELKNRRKKAGARDALSRFVASFQSDEERNSWVHGFLATWDQDRKLPHEIFVSLVFPVLLSGYRQQDAWAISWLAMSTQNLRAMDALSAGYASAAIDHKSPYALLKEAYALDPTDETRTALLRTNLDWFSYCEHEWPAGILYDHNGATVEQCEEIWEEIQYSRGLTENAAQTAFLDDFERKVTDYQRKLLRRSPACDIENIRSMANGAADESL